MTDVYKVFVQGAGELTMYDVSAIYSDKESSLKESARDRAAESEVHFQFQKDTPDLPTIKEAAEIWAGWQRDGAWLDGHVWGGFIMQSVGTLEGDTHHIHCTCSSFNILFTRRCFKGWPTGQDATGIPTGGIGAGYAVTDWLVSDGGLTGGASGIVRAMLPGLDYGGVDSSFDGRIFTAATLPSTADPDYPFLGSWAFTTVDKIILDIVGAVRKVWPAVQPVYWLEASTDGSIIRPRFVFHDDADVTPTIRGRFSTSPAPGEFYLG